jgi:exodeoxyribonuclease VII small subunit
MPEPTNDAAGLSFEAALTNLQEIVHDLEEGDLGLEPSLARFEEGIRLLRNCYQILERAEEKIEMLTGQDASGNPVTVPFDATATFEGAEQPAKKPGRRRRSAKGEGEGAAAEPAPFETESREEDRLF